MSEVRYVGIADVWLGISRQGGLERAEGRGGLIICLVKGGG